ncbi:hypothetical protein ACQP2E_15315 [Actinoplanes sp. CA-015351]|uniref:hypothetical protein n=1 Tax=Actinoplanes sp. CA-015351 TaxID=3239897 RepID=UPI003D978240
MFLTINDDDSPRPGTPTVAELEAACRRSEVLEGAHPSALDLVPAHTSATSEY